MMHGRGRSDSAIAAWKSVNKSERLAAEPMERRAGDQKKCGPANHAPGTEPGKRVTSAGTHTADRPHRKQGRTLILRGGKAQWQVSKSHKTAATATEKTVTNPGVLSPKKLWTLPLRGGRLSPPPLLPEEATYHIFRKIPVKPGGVGQFFLPGQQFFGRTGQALPTETHRKMTSGEISMF
jgi:hypothetical protein